MKKVIIFVWIYLLIFIELFAPYISVTNRTIYQLDCELSQDINLEKNVVMCLDPSDTQNFLFDKTTKECRLSVNYPETYQSLPGYTQRVRKTCSCDISWICEILDRPDKRELMLRLTPLMVNYERYQYQLKS